MAILKEYANAFELPHTKNVADIPEVSVNDQIEDCAGTKEDGSEFKYKAIIKNNEEYRIPNKVINDIKTILKEQPGLQTFKVARQGEGLKTKYTVIPLKVNM